MATSVAEIQVPVRDSRTGEEVGETALNHEIFGITPNVGVMHQVVTAQLGARRQGTHSTRTRAEVRGGGAKPWRQKGTGRARHGSTRAPQWRGGGVAHGPKPRSYAQRTPKKMIRLALHSALSDRAANEDVVVVDNWNFEAPKTKEAANCLKALGIDGRALIVLPRGEEHRNSWLSFQNLSRVHLLTADQLNCYDVMVSDKVIFTVGSLSSAEGSLSESDAEGSLSDADAEGSLPDAESSLSEADAEGSLPDADAEGSLPDAEGSLSESDAEGSLPDADAEGSLPDAEGSLSDAEGSLSDAEGSLSDTEGSLSDTENPLPDTEETAS